MLIIHLKMLVIFCMFPVAAPLKSMLHKHLVAQIVMVNLMWEFNASVRILFSIGRLYISSAINIFHIRIIKRVDVNRQP